MWKKVYKLPYFVWIPPIMIGATWWYNILFAGESDFSSPFLDNIFNFINAGFLAILSSFSLLGIIIGLVKAYHGIRFIFRHWRYCITIGNIKIKKNFGIQDITLKVYIISGFIIVIAITMIAVYLIAYNYLILVFIISYIIWLGSGRHYPK